MENIVLKCEWVKAISVLPEPKIFLDALVLYRITREETFDFPTERALFTAIKPEFDKLNFPLYNGNDCVGLQPSNNDE